MSTRYIVTIIEKTVEVKVRGNTWEMGAGENPDEYGYTPEIEKKVDVEREIFKQDIDLLNIVAVIKAVNGL